MNIGVLSIYMAADQDPSARTRAYRMRRRAEQVDQTRQRIVEAIVELHGTVGPAGTTVAGIAELAGVTRLTVYRHFPDDEALFEACTAHWASLQELPDPQSWCTVDDPAERLRVGLTDLYRFYRAGEPMLTRARRDKAALPEVQRQRMDAQDAAYRDVLLAPFKARGPRLPAVVGHAVSFWTWRSLCLDQDLPDSEAVELMLALASLSNSDTLRR